MRKIYMSGIFGSKNATPHIYNQIYGQRFGSKIAVSNKRPMNIPKPTNNNTNGN